MRNVSNVRGTSGKNRVGRLRGSSPSSPTRGTEIPITITAAVSSTIATSGAGTTFVRRGSSTITMSPTATRG